MKEAQKKFTDISLWVGIILFVVRWLFAGFNGGITFFTAYEVFGYAGEAIGATSILMVIYNKLLWKTLNFTKMPILANHYEGELLFTYGENMGERSVSIDIVLL